MFYAGSIESENDSLKRCTHYKVEGVKPRGRLKVTDVNHRNLYSDKEDSLY